MWSNSHHCPIPNTPRISWRVNWLSDEEVHGCHFWYVAWRAWHFNGSSAFTEHVPIITPTILHEYATDWQLTFVWLISKIGTR